MNWSPSFDLPESAIRRVAGRPYSVRGILSVVAAMYGGTLGELQSGARSLPVTRVRAMGAHAVKRLLPETSWREIGEGLHRDRTSGLYYFKVACNQHATCFEWSLEFAAIVETIQRVYGPVAKHDLPQLEQLNALP